MVEPQYNPGLPHGFTGPPMGYRHDQLRPVALPGGPYAPSLGADPNCELPTSNLAPHFHPPHDSSSVSFKGRVVVNVAVADNAAANAAGIALAAAENALNPLAAVLVTTPAGATGTPIRVRPWDYRAKDGWTTVVKRWGVSVLNADDQAAVVLAQLDKGPNVGSTPPVPGLSGTSADLQEPTMLLIPDNGSLSFSIGNRDVNSPLLVELTWTGWRIPAKYTGTLRSLTRDGNLGFGGCA